MNDGRPLHPGQVKALLVKILTEGGNVEFRPHARQEMENDGITELQVVSVLRGGVVEPAEFINNEWRYRVRVPPLYVVVTLMAETHTAVVTAWKRTKP